MWNAVRFGRTGLLSMAILFLLPTAGHGLEESGLEREAPSLRAWFGQAASRGWFRSPRDGVRIEYAVLPAADEKGAILLLPGESSSFLQYRELAYDLRGIGFSLYMMDHRGQGLSARLLDDPARSYVHDYRDWMADLHAFYGIVASQRPHGRVFLLGHSVGAVMAALFASENPALLSGIVLANPLFRFQTPLPEPIAYALLRVEILFGREKGPSPWPMGDPGTKSAVRTALSAADGAEARVVPQGGATVRLLKEIRDLGTRALRRAPRIQAPVLLLEAAEDAIARRDMMEEAGRRMRSCRRLVIDQAGHDLFFERDAARSAALDAVRAFLEGISRP